VSLELYPALLKFDGRRGWAKWDGSGVPLAAMPAVAGLPRDTTEIEWAPGICAWLRERCDARRDMQAGEILAVRLWLSHGGWR
jgi:hypothetical protein